MPRQFFFLVLLLTFYSVTSCFSTGLSLNDDKVHTLCFNRIEKYFCHDHFFCHLYHFQFTFDLNWFDVILVGMGYMKWCRGRCSFLRVKSLLQKNRKPVFQGQIVHTTMCMCIKLETGINLQQTRIFLQNQIIFHGLHIIYTSKHHMVIKQASTSCIHIKFRDHIKTLSHSPAY